MFYSYVRIYCIKNTTVWNLTSPPANLALIPQQHVIHHQSITDIRYSITLCKLLEFSFWIVCTPSIEVDTTEQVARQNQPNIYMRIYTQQTTKYSNIHDIGRTFDTITQIRRIKITRYILAPYQVYNLRPHIVRPALSTQSLWLLFQVCKMVI